MSHLTQVSTALQQILTTVADEAATSSACVQRVRRFTGATWVRTLVLGCLATPEPSLTDLAQTAASLGVEVTPQAIAHRFTPATVACLEQVLHATVQHVITADPVAIPVLARFPGVCVLDTSTISLPPTLAPHWPGCGNGSQQPAAALKLGVQLDLLHGTLTGPLSDSGRTHDRRCAITATPMPPGALRLADLGFWLVTELATLTAQEVFWLSRLQAQTAVLTPAGKRFDLDRVLATTTEDALDLEIRLGAERQVSARLVAHRVPSTVAETRRRRMREEGTRRGTTPSRSRLARADWLLLVTNIPAERLTPAEALVLARARWQIELLFKLWKSHGHIDDVRSANPWRILAELYAKLVAMVLQHWTILLGCWAFATRSLVKAAATVRRYAPMIALALDHPRHLRQVLQRLITALAHSGRQNPRHKRPNLYQLLLDCEHTT